MKALRLFRRFLLVSGFLLPNAFAQEAPSSPLDDLNWIPGPAVEDITSFAEISFPEGPGIQFKSSNKNFAHRGTIRRTTSELSSHSTTSRFGRKKKVGLYQVTNVDQERTVSSKQWVRFSCTSCLCRLQPPAEVSYRHGRMPLWFRGLQSLATALVCRQGPRTPQ